jgi:hypothetical protein
MTYVKLLLAPLHAVKPTSQALSAALLVLVVQLISGVPVLLAVRAEAYLATQVVIGAVLVGLFLRRRLDFAEFVGLGFAIGSLVAMCIDQLLVQTPIRPISWAFIPLAAIAIVLSPKLRGYTTFSESEKPLPILFIAFLLLFVLVHERYWPLYIAISIIPLLLFNAFKPKNMQKPATRIINGLLSAVTIVVAFVVLQNRPNLWWIKTQDFQFFEALSYSLTHWGSNDQVFVQGQPVLYHWFSYAWMGLTTKAIDAPTWVVQTKVAPIFVSLAIIYLVFALLKRVGITGWRASIALIAFALLNDFNFESFSMVFSYIWLLALAYFLIQWSEKQHWRLVFVTSFMAAGALGAKSSNIAVIVTGCGMLFLFQLAKQTIKPMLVVAHGLIVAFALGVVYLKLYFNSPYDATINFGTVGIAQDIFGDVDSLPRPQFIFWSLIILLNVLLVYFVATISTRNLLNPAFKHFWQFFVGTVVATTAALLITVSYYEQEEYFLHAFVLFGSLVVGIAVGEFVQLLRTTTDRRPLLVSSTIMLLCVGVVRLAFRDDNSGEFWAIRSRIVNGSSIVVLLLATILIGFIMRKRMPVARMALVFVACSTLVTAFTSNDKWFTFQQRFKDEVTQPPFADFMIGAIEIQKFLQEAKILIPSDAVVASNYECDETQCPASSIGADRLDWEVGGEAMLMSIYLERRMFISGYGFLWQNVELPEFAKDRMRLSSDFANAPTQELAFQLRQAGVDYFIVDKSRVDTTGRNVAATVLLEDKRFELVSFQS